MKKEEKNIISTKELCLLINKTKQTIRDYVVIGGMPRLSRGKYDAQKCLEWFNAKEENRKRKKKLIEKAKQARKKAAKAKEKKREKAKKEKKSFEKTCLFCSKTFTAKNSFSVFLKKQKFCSNFCARKHAAKKASTTASCLNCGKIFQKKKAMKKKYCSYACAASHSILMKCSYCKTEFKAKATAPRKFCSSKCFKKAHESPQKTIRGRMTTAIKKALVGQKSGRSWELLVGYNLEQLCKHLESLFANGMTWENIGEWHIDHVIPESKFNYNSVEDPDFKRCWALENLQPLWAKDNLIKSDSLAKPFQPFLSFVGTTKPAPTSCFQFVANVDL